MAASSFIIDGAPWAAQQSSARTVTALAWPGHASTRRPGPAGPARPLAAIVGLSVVLGGCFTGPRSELRPDLSTTGDAAIDAVLSRVEQVGAAVFTASYDADNAFAGTTTPVTITQSAPDRRVTVIGDVSYVVEGPRVRTCSDSSRIART